LPDLLVRAPIAAAAEAGGSAVESLFLEARLASDAVGTRGLTGHAWTLMIVLAVLGALFTTYRCLRQQLRGVSQIADRLQSHRDRLEHELESLRIGDTLGGVTSAWNELIDLTDRLRQSVQRTEANVELTRALQHSGGGALAEALNAMPDGLVYIADEVRFEYANAAALRFFGWTAEVARESPLAEAKAAGAAGRVLDLLRGALQPGGSYDARNEVIETDDGGEHNQSSYRVRVIPLHRAHQSGECIVLIRDVSQQIRADRAREDFITQVTHELRTPLTNIRAYTETLSSGMFDDPNIITECYNVITKETRRLSRLVEDILSVSQLEVGTIELHVDDVDLKSLLNDAVRDVRGLADDKNIDLQLILPAKLENIRGDRDKLAVVFNNLLGNAIKYTKAGGSVIVGCQFGQDEVVVTVKDNGIGIDPSDHARVFEKFQRAKDPDVLAEAGTGIGLYTAREIVRRHRGDIELISAKGQGSTFLTRLPRAETRASALTTPQETSAHAPNPDRGR
jgi:PAS domain S-box-containing protein